MVEDLCVMSLRERSQTMGEVENKFRVLVKFPELPNEELEKQCKTLSNALRCSGQSGLNEQELALELQTFPDLPRCKMTNSELQDQFPTGEETEGFP